MPVPSNACVPRKWLPTLNVTDPVGTPASYFRFTTEVSITALFFGTVVGDTVSEVEVAAITVTFTGALTELWSVASPPYFAVTAYVPGGIDPFVDAVNEAAPPTNFAVPNTLDP